MFRSYRVCLWAGLLGLTVLLSGCGPQASQNKQMPTSPPEGENQQKPAEHAEHPTPKPESQQGQEDKSGKQAASDVQKTAAPADVASGLAELSATDRAAAEKQRVCPVSGGLLGSMGIPYKVTVKGQTVFLCCPDCEQAIMKDPDKYLAKLKDSKAG